MSGKYMNVKRIIIPTITMVILASQLMGCGAVTQSELLKMINNNQAIEIEVATPINAEQGTENSLTWVELALLNTTPDLRNSWDTTLGITGTGESKNGMLYVNANGDHEPNNTLAVALSNEKFQSALENSDKELATAVLNYYADLEADETHKAILMGINAYFNLLPDATPNYANANSTLQRNEFMAMVMRAETPVNDGLMNSTSFDNAVGKSDYNLYAQSVATNSYLDLASKSLNNQTANGTITRAEAVYLIVSRYFADDFKSADITADAYDDCKDGGDIATQQKFIENNTKKDYWKSYELTYALQNPDQGMPTDLYKALVVAKEHNLINDTDSRWDEGLTRSEAIELLVNTYTIVGNTFSSDGAILETEVTAPTTTDGSMGSANLSDMPLEDGETEYVDPAGEVSEEPEQESTGIVIVEELDLTMYTTSGCNVRSGDGTNYDQVAFTEKGTALHVTGKTSNGWYRVDWENTEDGSAYISGSLLSTTKPSTQTSSTGGNSNNGGSNQQQPSQPTQPSQPSTGGGLIPGVPTGPAPVEGGSGAFKDWH